jgi:hypothetical protein
MGAQSKDLCAQSILSGVGSENLFVTDGGCSSPTLTKIRPSIMAIAWRSCEYLMEELKKANV